ncbi:MAG: hypothetical protein IJN74_01450 [Clostridia bacterium]|nr:hypothetical protein [Clostridia bacterium]
MIKVFGRLLCVPENEKMLGYVDDNLVETRKFKITDPALHSFSFKLELENGSFINIMDLPGEMEDDALILTWQVPASCLRFAGPLFAQLRAFNDEDMVWHSDIAEFSVCRSLQAEKQLPHFVPTEFAEMEKRMTEILRSAEDASLSTETFLNAAKDASQSAEAAAGEAASFSETYFASAAACKNSVAKAGEILGQIKVLEKAIKTTQESIEKMQGDTYDALRGAEKFALESRTHFENIKASLGDLHEALDAVLTLENAYMGGAAL